MYSLHRRCNRFHQINACKNEQHFKPVPGQLKILDRFFSIAGAILKAMSFRHLLCFKFFFTQKRRQPNTQSNGPHQIVGHSNAFWMCIFLLL